jgi:hypothetical protein
MQKAITVPLMAAGIGPSGLEHAEDNRASAGPATDLHSKRIRLDLDEWYSRLTKLAELRAGGQ